MANILIVDDDAMDREMAARSLRSLPDLIVEYCEDGLAALEHIAKASIHNKLYSSVTRLSR